MCSKLNKSCHAKPPGGQCRHRLCEIYGADTFFDNSSLINLLNSLSYIIAMNAQNSVIRNEQVKLQINSLRQDIVDEYRKLMH